MKNITLEFRMPIQTYFLKYSFDLSMPDRDILFLYFGSSYLSNRNINRQIYNEIDEKHNL
jgi:hypothetical protein